MSKVKVNGYSLTCLLRVKLTRKPLDVLLVMFISGLLATVTAAANEPHDRKADVNVDLELTYGLTSRTGKRDSSLTSPNSNDGDENYDRGIISSTIALTAELEATKRNMGLFIRTHGFFDYENQRSSRVRTPLSSDAKDISGRDLRLLDGYVYANFDQSSTPMQLRIGNQVLNWGESTFIPKGINIINPYDVARLRTPGSELRDSLIPVPMVSASAFLSDDVTVEGFYQIDWKKSRVDPSGTYFSTNDYATPGGTHVYLTQDGITDTGRTFGPLADALNHNYYATPANTGNLPLQLEHDPKFFAVDRSPDREVDEQGQWGLGIRYFSEALNDTEFGFFFINNHSQLPLVSGLAATQATYRNVLGMSQTLGGVLGTQLQSLAAAARTNSLSPQALGQARSGTAIATGVARAAGILTPAAHFDQNGLNASGLAALQNALQSPVFLNSVQEQISSTVRGLVVDRYVKASRYFVEYPEDIQTFGISFNTALSDSGWALQGEYSYHSDVPLQREENSLFAEALAPLGCAPTCPADILSVLGLQNNLGYLRGYVVRDVSQLQITATKLFGSALGSDSTGFIIEGGMHHVHDMPEKETLPIEHGHAGGGSADATSYGVRGALWLDYSNAVHAASLRPYMQYAYGIKGDSPGPGGLFQEDRIILTLGVGLNYLNRWTADIGYTSHSGDNNYLSGRDFIQASLSYYF
ncbi:MAG: DUF1302 domain-containing protein [Gammaproteobacteria bacterium]|nr:DUF1302 domain-containing protein [Gammaproteobacteria bacterium]